MGCACCKSIKDEEVNFRWDKNSLGKDTKLVIDEAEQAIYLKEQNDKYELCLIEGNCN